MADDPVVIVGAGLAGLSCARLLADAGVAVRVVERARGVGGRCATRRIEGQPVDLGPAFLHGSDARFLAAARAVEDRTPTRWPLRVRGQGAACHPSSFLPGESQFVYSAGLNALPKQLARGLDVQLASDVVGLDICAGEYGLAFADGSRQTVRRLVLAMALEQSARLLQPLAQEEKALRGTLALLETMGSAPCIALLAGYAKGARELPWDLWYPEDSKILQLLSLDSQKRASPEFDVLVLQARPRWSRENLTQSEESWRRALLEEAARLVGPWAREPAWSQTHRWSFARTVSGTELSGPILHRFGEKFIGLAGDVFSPGGGAQGAFLSGAKLAERILQSG